MRGNRRGRDLALLLALALALRLGTAWLLDQPGYTDAYYYAVGARQLAGGQGFTEPFIWNWLDPPQTVVHPGYAYWLPLTAMLGGLGRALLGASFRAIEMPFVLLSALLPLVAYGLAWDLTRERKHALLAGLLGLFPGFYAHLFVLPDNFAPFALAGSLSLWAAGRGLREGRPFWFGLAGLAAGFAHLARADGLLLLGVLLLSMLLPPSRKASQGTASADDRPTVGGVGGLPQTIRAASAKKRTGCYRLPATGYLLLAAGYLLIMGPWFLRNQCVLGSPLGGAGISTIFLTSYDDLFTYGWPLSPESYLAWGWGAILASKWKALLLNLQRLWVEGLLIFLPPFVALGLWRLRRERLLWPFFLYAPLLFLSMTFVFTFPGMRGGLFHSGGALLPFFFAVAGPGLETMLRWAARRFRGWQVRRAWPVFSAGLVGLALLVTVLALARAGVLNGDWNRRDGHYARIGNWLAEQGVSPEAVVMVGDAPAFTWHTGHPAIAIPNEPLETILAVADRYGARYLVLDDARPRTTDGLYAGETSHPRLVLRDAAAQASHWRLYEIVPGGN